MRIIIIIVLSLKCLVSISQIPFTGKILQKHSEKPIEFANIEIKGLFRGTISNSEGEFELLINKLPCIIKISCIGYESNEVLIRDEKSLVIYIEEKNYLISEINVKPQEPNEIVKEAIDAIEDNYIVTPFSFKAYYRNIFRQNGHSVRLEEAICAFFHNGYVLKRIDPMENSFYQNRTRNFEGRGIYRYFDTHIDPNDKVEIIALRKSYDFSKTITKYFVTGGPFEVLAYDKVKYKNEFLDVNNLKYYAFKIDSILPFGDKEVYQISFKPNSHKKLKGDDYRKIKFRRKYYAAEFEGKLFIDIKTKAILRINYQIVKNKNHTVPFPFRVDLNYMCLGNKYFLYSARCEKQVELKTGIKGEQFDTFNIVSSLLVDKNMELYNPERIKDEKSFSFSDGLALYKYKKQYDEQIWTNFNKILPNDSEEQMIRELGDKTPIEFQFKYPDSLTMNLFSKENSKSDYLYSIAHNVKSESYFKKYDTLTQKIFVNFGHSAKEEKSKYKLQIGEYFEDETESSDFPLIKKVEKDGQSITVFNTAICQEEFPELEYEEFSVSPNENFIIIFLADANTDICSNIKIYDLKTKKLINSCNYIRNLLWCNDSTIVYSKHDTISQKGKFIYQTSLKSFNNKKLIYTEEDPYMESDVYLLDSNYFAIHSMGFRYDELRISPTNNINIKLVSPKKENVLYHIKRANGEMYVLKRSQEKWDLCYYEHNKNELLSIISLDKEKWVRDFEVTNKYFIFSILENSFSKIVFFPKDNIDSAFYADSINPLADIAKIKINSYEGDIVSVYEFTVPGTYEKITININKHSFIKEMNKYLENSSEYVIRRIFAESSDKQKIPITIVYKKGLALKNIPVVLEAYGSYGTNLFPQSNSLLIPLLEEGVAYATAHVRGSGYNGIHWYLDGKLKNKPNGINDLLTCSEYLVKKGITTEKQLCLYGRSAGGLIVGAAINRNPKICKAVVYDKACVDLISSIEQGSFNSKYHYFEWGSPNIKEELAIMDSYSPLQNLPRKYPNTFMIIGINDKMVDPKSSLAFLRKLNDVSNGSNFILANIYENEGHQESFNERTNSYRTALMYTFIINEVK